MAEKIENADGASNISNTSEEKVESQAEAALDLIESDVDADAEAVLAEEMLLVLRTKNKEVTRMRKLLPKHMRSWIQDMAKNVEKVKNEVKNTKDLILPTCAVLDKLKGKFNELDELGQLVKEILAKMEIMMEQIPVVTEVISVAMEHFEVLKGRADVVPPSTNSALIEVLEAESSSSDEPRTLENSPRSSNESDPIERDQGNEIDSKSKSDESVSAEQKDVTTANQAYECVEPEKDSEELGGAIRKTRSRTKEKDSRSRPRSSSLDEEASTRQDDKTYSYDVREVISMLSTRNQEMDETKLMLINVLKYWIKDMLPRIEYVTNEATASRNLVFHTLDVVEGLDTSATDGLEIKDLVNDIYGKIETLMSQVSVATLLVETAIERMGTLRGLENFRREMFEAEVRYLPKSSSNSQETLQSAATLNFNESDRKDARHNNAAADTTNERDNKSTSGESSLGEQLRGAASVVDLDLRDSSFFLESETETQSSSFVSVPVLTELPPAPLITESLTLRIANESLGRSPSSHTDTAENHFSFSSGSESDVYESSLEDNFSIEEEDPMADLLARQTTRFQDELVMAIHGLQSCIRAECCYEKYVSRIS